MNVLSLFDGISCGRIALDRAGIKVDNYFASEVDPNAIKISSNNYPDIVQLGDVKDISINTIKQLPKIDLILAGSPCQGFSRSGKGLNFDDPRSKLFFNFVLILGFVKNYNNPNVKFLLENVKMKNEWRDIITDNVNVEPIEINSKLLTAQNRPRMYWSDIEGIKQPEDKNILLKDVVEKDLAGDYVDHQGLKVCKSFSEGSRNLINVVNGEVQITQSTIQGYKVAVDGDGINISFPTSKSRRGRVIDQKSSTLDCACNIGVYINGTIRRLTIDELERLQTLPLGYTEGVGMGARKKAIGNGWTVDVITHILKGMKEE